MELRSANSVPQTVVSYVAMNGSESSDDGSLSDGFEFDEDEDEVRQRELMSGPARVSLAESEARARKRHAGTMEVPFPTRTNMLPPILAAQRAGQRRACCAHCGELLCRSARTLRDQQLSNAADYGLSADFALHFGAFRCASQVLAFAKLLHERLCPPSLRDLPYDLELHLMRCVALTLSCERTQLRVQGALRHNKALARIVPYPTPVLVDCMVIALKAERYEIAEMLVWQLADQVTCSAFVRPLCPRYTLWICMAARVHRITRAASKTGWAVRHATYIRKKF